MRYIGSLQPTVTLMALMCALVIFSADREELSTEGHARVEQLQVELIPVSCRLSL